MRITPKPVQKPMPTYIGSFSKPSIELAARLGCGLIVAPFAAAMSYGGLKQVADLYHETCAKHGTQARPADVQLLHAFRRQPAAGGRAARAPDPLLQGMRDPGASRAIPKTAPPSYRYFIDMVERLHKVQPGGPDREFGAARQSPARITDTLKKVEAAGFAEVILYFNVGLKPHEQVKDEMDRFMREVAPAFGGAAKVDAA